MDLTILRPFRIGRLISAGLVISGMLIHPLQLWSQQCTLDAPATITVNSVASCNVSYSWTRVSGADKYKVKYKKSGTTSWKGNLKITDTTYKFTGLSANTSYILSVQSVCASGKVSNKSISTTIATAACEMPSAYSVTSVGPATEKISVTVPCAFDSVHCRYGTAPDELIELKSAKGSDVLIENLSPGVTYYFKVSTCPLSYENFMAVDSFMLTEPAPNILLILLDDARQDAYSCSGAPPFMQTPNIDRIADEGIRFQNSFVVHSLCAPSRATIATGVYTHRHGVFDNVNQRLLDPALPLLPKVLHDHGYTTALVGKNHSIFDYNEGEYFDYWLEFTSRTDGYNLNYRYANSVKTMAGYSTDVLTDSAVAFINRAQQPFMIWLAYHAPHEPFIPSDEFIHVFDSVENPLGPDTARFSVNYPSAVYEMNSYQAAGAEADSLQRKVYEMLLSVDKGVGKVLAALDSTGQLDNTFILFTSDNGHLLGEHNLDMKRVAYEPSLRVPLFIRYPSWFAPGTVDSANFALNIDIVPTVLEAAQIPQTFETDGQSVRNFYSGSAARNIFYYHYWYSTEGAWYKLPAIHAVRDQHYILVNYGCSESIVQEFFDLQNDPMQLTNQINNAAFSGLIQTYRTLLDSFRIAYGDTAAETLISCSLSNPQYTRQEQPVFTSNYVCFPNPSDGEVTIHNTGESQLHFEVSNELGQVLFQFEVASGDKYLLHGLNTGLFFLKEVSGKDNNILKLLVQ
jgi:arylsulfatase A-like enzyme